MTKMIEVTQEDGNNYCRVLTALGMEEEGDPVAAVERLRADNTIQRRALAELGADNDKLRAALERIGKAQSLYTAQAVAGMALHGWVRQQGPEGNLEDYVPRPPCGCREGECESKPAHHCRMTDELGTVAQ